jgi:hypothetical protein
LITNPDGTVTLYHGTTNGNGWTRKH